MKNLYAPSCEKIDSGRGNELLKIHLGCGEKKKAGYSNVDLFGEPDVRCDLNVFPWPWADNSVDEIFCEHWLEHVDNYEKTMLEVYRILKPNGIFHAKVPHFRAPMTIWHLHKQSFSVCTPQRLAWSFPYLWDGRQLFKEATVHLNFNYPQRMIAWLFNWLANCAPNQWDALGLPTDEIEFKVKKNDKQ